MNWLALDKGASADQDARYFRELRRMTAKKWMGAVR